MEGVPAPVDHKYVPPPVAVNVVELPWQKVRLGEEICATGIVFTVMLWVAVDVPQLVVAVTVNTPVVVTVIDGVVAPVDQLYEVPPEAVSITEPPKQNVVGPLAAMLTVEPGFTVTGCEAVAVPHELVSVTI